MVLLKWVSRKNFLLQRIAIIQAPWLSIRNILMNSEFTPYGEFGNALCLLHEGAYDGDFEVRHLVTGHDIHFSLKDLQMED